MLASYFRLCSLMLMLRVDSTIKCHPLLYHSKPMIWVRNYNGHPFHIYFDADVVYACSGIQQLGITT